MNTFALDKVTEPDEKKKTPDTKPSLPLRKYAGRFQDKLHSEMVVREKDGVLTAKMNGLDMTLTHWHFDTFIAREKSGVLPGILFTFSLNDEGKVDEVRFSFGEKIKLPRIGDIKEDNAKKDASKTEKKSEKKPDSKPETKPEKKD